MGFQDLSNAAEYQAVLDAGFTEYLVRQKASRKTAANYRADVRHFIHWLLDSVEHADLKQDLAAIAPETVENYKRSLVLARTPAATTNRRLSALRMFFQCALVHGWVRENPVLTIRNIPRAVGDLTPQASDELIETYFRENATQPGFAVTDSDDVREFLSWLSQNAIP